MKLLQMLLQEEMEQCLFLCATVFERSGILICVLLKKLIVNCLSMNSQCMNKADVHECKMSV